MSYISWGVEYALHSMLYLSEVGDGSAPSVQELATFQQIPRAFVAKLFTKLEKAGLVSSAEGAKGGYALARPAREITVLDVVDAVDGHKKLFDCANIRSNCILFNDNRPSEKNQGICNIHQVMLEAEHAVRTSLASHNLADINGKISELVPVKLMELGNDWFAERARQRTAKKQVRK